MSVSGPTEAHPFEQDTLLALARGLSMEMYPERAPGIERLGLGASLEEDFGFDSLSRAELLSRLEDTFDVTFPDSVMTEAVTPNDLLRFLGEGSGREQSAPILSSEPATLKGRIDRRVALESRTLVEVLEQHARAHPHRVHTTFLDEHLNPDELTYGALLEGARNIANGLWRLGVGHGDSVALMLPSDRTYFITFMGVLLAGGVPVPIYPPVRPSQLESHLRRHARILDNAQTKRLITVAQGKLVSGILSGHVPTLEGAVTPEELLDAPLDGALAAAFNPVPEDTALIQYTSGSTGDPKGVVLSHGQLLANIRAMGEGIGIDDEDVFVSWLPLYHDMGLIGAWLGSGLCFGAHLVLMSPVTFLRRPVSWLHAMDRYRGTLSAAPNFAYEMAVHRVRDEELGPVDLTPWRMAFNGAEPVSASAIEAFCERFSNHGFRRETMSPVFGLAECSLGLTFPPLGREPVIDLIDADVFAKERRAVPSETDNARVLRLVGCGHPLPGYHVRIVDDNGAQLDERSEGHLQFRGPSATSGYFRNSDANTALFDSGWLNTGDLAYLADGELFITRRSKDMIIRGGRNFFPYELEEAVGDLDGIRKGCVAVFGSSGPEGASERVVVLAEIRGSLSEEGAREAITTAIQSCAVETLGIPADDIVLAAPNSVLKTSSGKIRRSACRDAYEAGHLGDTRRPVWWQIVRLSIAGVPGLLRRAAASTYRNVWGIGCWLVLAMLALMFYPLIVLGPKAAAWPLARTAVRLANALTGTTPQITRYAPEQSKHACVLVANHASYMDWLVTIAAVDVPFAFVAKAELANAPLIGLLLRKLDTHFVERFDARQSVADAEQVGLAVKGGQSLAIYPEGTFRRAPGVAPFRLGAFQAAVQAQAPVIPISISGTRQMLPDGVWLPRPAALEITIGEPIHPDGGDWAAAISLRDQARAAVANYVDEPLLTFAIKPPQPDKD